MEFDDSNSRQQKRSLTTMKSVSAEWKSGSKKRVIKYYVVYMGIGLVVGAIIGMCRSMCSIYLMSQWPWPKHHLFSSGPMGVYVVTPLIAMLEMVTTSCSL
jgi:hypothetical protein